MADEKILKPKSFRIDDKTAEKFKEISGSIGGNQQETLAKLIEAWEFQKGKAILTEKKSEIEQFERYVTLLTRMFMGSLEDAQNITETVRTEFEALLQSKDTTIQDLQSQLAVSKKLAEEATDKARAFEAENSRLSSKLDDVKSRLTDKENLNRALQESCNDLKAKVDLMDEEHKEVVTLRRDIANIKDKRDSLEQEIVKIQIEQDKTVLAIEKKHQERIQNLKEHQQAEIDGYQKKYLDLLEEMRKK